MRATTLTPRAPSWKRIVPAGLVLAATLLVALAGGCGGGVGSGGTGGFASGPITGFGSVIVNDVRFEDASATVQDGDGVARTRDDLKLGMMVEIDSSAISNGAAVANAIRYDSDLLGTVGSVDVANNSFSVLGQNVLVDAATVFAESLGGLAALRPGVAVEVYAVYDPAAVRYRATRVAMAAASATAHVRGLVAQSDAGTKTLRIGNVTYAYNSVSDVPAGVGAGQYVRLKIASPTPVAGSYPVQSFGTAVPAVPDSENCSVKGLVSSLVSTASFSVNGRAVNASGASFPNGSTGLVVGANVVVDGSVQGGVLRATRVTIATEAQEIDHLFELHGAITAVNAAQQTFALRGVTVSSARRDLVYSNGSAANLVVGRQVTVKGLLSADGLRVDATSIAFE